MKRLPVTAAVLIVGTFIMVTISESLGLGPWGLFVGGTLVMFLTSLTDREAFYGPNSDTRR